MFADNFNLTRRSLVKGLATAGAAAVGGASALIGCSRETGDVFVTGGNDLQIPKPDVAEVIIPGSGYNNCKGRCANNAHVKNGVIKRFSTDERVDEPGNPQLRSCLRCRAYKNKIYSPGRLLYPLIYAPNDPTAERGDLSKFQRVTWDEAAAYIKKRYDEIKRDHPDMMVFKPIQTGMYGRFQGRNFFERVINEKMGGYKSYWSPYAPSFHAGSYLYPIVAGDAMSGIEYTPENLMKSKTIFLWGSNCVNSTGSTAFSWWLVKAKENGAKLIYIGPVFNKTAELADEFVPIKPGTDTALILAMLHVMIKENLVMSEDFIRKFIVGFYDDPTGSITQQLTDKATTRVPAGESLSAYILGSSEQGSCNATPFSITMKSDSTKYAFKKTFADAKTPEWAAPICGISADKIKELARIFANSGKPCAIRSSIGMQRQPNGLQNCWLLLAMCLVTGNWGIDGTGLALHYYTALPNTNSLAGTLAAAASAGANPDVNTAGNNAIVVESIWMDAVRAQGDPANNAKWTFDAEIMAIDRPVKILYSYAGNSLVNQHPDTFASMELLKDRSKVELIITVDNHMTSSARWSDVILPADTHYEREDLIADQNYILYQGKAVEPMGEIKANDEIGYIIGNAFGMTKQELNPDGKSYAERIEDSWIGKNRMMTLDQFKKIGVYHENKVGIAQKNSDIRAAGAINDTFKLSTATGYFELYSNNVVNKYVSRDQTGIIHNHSNADSDGNPEVLPIPFWIDYQSSYVDLYRGTYDNASQLNISEYPYIVLGQHSIWRVHSNHSGVASLRELYKKDKDGNPVYDNGTYSNPDWKNVGSTGILSQYGKAYEPIWMSPKDVAELRLTNGQLVKVTSAQTRKSLIASVQVTGRCLPGVMVLEQGSWFDPVELKDGTMVDRGGCSNTLISEMPSRNDRNNGMMLCQIKIEPFDESEYK